jgi:preprotein translocase subunit YajC
MFSPGQDVVVSGGVWGRILAVGKDHVIVRLSKMVLELSMEEVQTPQEYEAWVAREKKRMGICRTATKK